MRSWRTIVGVTTEVVATPLKLPIQIRDQEVGEQRREHAMDTKNNFEFERQIALNRSDTMLDLRLKK